MTHAILNSLAALQARHETDAGQTVIEYALIVAVVSIALIVAMTGFGGDLITKAASKVTALAPA